MHFQKLLPERFRKQEPVKDMVLAGKKGTWPSITETISSIIFSNYREINHFFVRSKFPTNDSLCCARIATIIQGIIQKHK